MTELIRWQDKDLTEYYNADDVDVVLTEKDEEIAELKADYKEACGRLQTANLIKDEQIAATRHQKYKRCLMMAKWCKAGMYLSYESDFKREWWNKWHKRWLKIAEKFKETK